MDFINGENFNHLTQEEIVDIFVIDSLHTAVNLYGIEGVEDKINDLYKLMPTLRERMLSVYNRQYKGK
jgi:cell division septal protein FtsQ